MVLYRKTDCKKPTPTKLSTNTLIDGMEKETDKTKNRVAIFVVCVPHAWEKNRPLKLVPRDVC